MRVKLKFFIIYNIFVYLNIIILVVLANFSNNIFDFIKIFENIKIIHLQIFYLIIFLNIILLIIKVIEYLSKFINRILKPDTPAIVLCGALISAG